MTVNISLKYLTFVEMFKKKEKSIATQCCGAQSTDWLRLFYVEFDCSLSVYVGSLRVPRNMSVNSCLFVLVLQ